jgi:hypothetical protein
MLYPARTTYRTLQPVEKQEEIWHKILKERTSTAAQQEALEKGTATLLK